MKKEYQNLLIHPTLIEQFTNLCKELEDFHKDAFDFHKVILKMVEDNMKRTKRFLAIHNSLTKAADQQGVDLMVIEKKLTIIHNALQKKERQTELAKSIMENFPEKMNKIKGLTKIFEDGAKHLKKHRKDLSASQIKIELMEKKLGEAKAIFVNMFAHYTEYCAMMEQEKKVYNTLVE